MLASLSSITAFFSTTSCFSRLISTKLFLTKNLSETLAGGERGGIDGAIALVEEAK
jgi:hypothetical protein